MDEGVIQLLKRMAFDLALDGFCEHLENPLGP